MTKDCCVMRALISVYLFIVFSALAQLFYTKIIIVVVIVITLFIIKIKNNCAVYTVYTV